MYMKRWKKRWFLGLMFLIIFLKYNVQNIAANITDNPDLPITRIENSINELCQRPMLFGYINSDFGTLSVKKAIPCYEYVSGGLRAASFRIIPIYSGENVFLNALEICSDGFEDSNIQLTQMYTRELTGCSDEILALIFDAQRCYAITSESACEISKFSMPVESRDCFTNEQEALKKYADQIISNDSVYEPQELEYGNIPSMYSYAKISVAYVNQVYSNTCWAACISSTMKKVTGISKTVETIAKAQYGNDFNHTASLEQCQYLISLLYNYQYPVVSNSAPSNTTIYNNINAGYPMITKWSSGSMNHAMVVHGINTDSYPTVYIMDPEAGFSSAQKGTNYFYISTNGTGLSLTGYLSKRS